MSAIPHSVQQTIYTAHFNHK